MNMTIATVLTTLIAMLPTAVPVDYPPTDNSDWKPYEDYRCITDINSPNYSLLQGGVHEADGLINIDGYYAVALGQNFGAVGDKFIVTFEDGHKTKIIIADLKANQDTRDGWVGHNGHIIEAVVDTDYLPQEIKTMGTVGINDKFSGEITKIEKEI